MREAMILKNKIGVKERRTIRINTCYSARTNKMLRELSTSCVKRPSTMVEMLVRFCLENKFIIEQFQERYNVNPGYRINGMDLNARGQTEYVIGRKPKQKFKTVENDNTGLIQSLPVDAYEVEGGGLHGARNQGK